MGSVSRSTSIRTPGHPQPQPQPQELDQIAPGRSQVLEATGFVNSDEVGPISFGRAFPDRRWPLAPAYEASPTHRCRKPQCCRATLRQRSMWVGLDQWGWTASRRSSLRNGSRCRSCFLITYCNVRRVVHAGSPSRNPPDGHQLPLHGTGCTNGESRWTVLCCR